MTGLIGQIGEAAIGWLEMIAGRTDGRSRFSGTTSGLATALLFYVIVVIVALALQSLDMGVLEPIAAVTGLAINALPLLGIYLGLLR